MTASVKPELKLCDCVCGSYSRGADFMPGHDVAICRAIAGHVGRLKNLSEVVAHHTDKTVNMNNFAAGKKLRVLSLLVKMSASIVKCLDIFLSRIFYVMAIKEDENKSGVIDGDPGGFLTNDLNAGCKLATVANFSRFIFFSILLIVPLYAITDSVINQNWIMVIIDALLVPVGFVHGLLLLFGIVE